MTSPAKPSTRRHATGVAVALLLLFGAGLYLRVEMVRHTTVERAIRADARDYYTYAVNLWLHGVHSLGDPRNPEPLPDARRNPGYPLFLQLFVELPPTSATLNRVAMAQALLSAATVLLAFGLYRSFLAPPLALTAALLTALSPHLVAMNVYLLTESLVTLFLVAGAWCAAGLDGRKRGYAGWARPLGAGLLFGCAALVRPGLPLLPLALASALLALFGWRRGLRTGAIVVAGFSLAYGPWVIRNAMDHVAPSDVIARTLQHGMYPELMYRGDPATYPSQVRK